MITEPYAVVSMGQKMYFRKFTKLAPLVCVMPKALITHTSIITILYIY